MGFRVIILIGMAISVKGIQYSYQIDFFNQVPTRLKSQIHDLPVLSVQEPTPIDENVGRNAVVPNNDQRQSFAGVRAASTGLADSLPNTDVQTNTPETPDSAQVSAAPLPGVPVNEAINTGYNSTPANLLAARNPIQIAPDSELNLNRQRPEPTENLSAPPSFQPQINSRTSPAVEAEDIPVADRNPVEPVKGIPRALYLMAQRAYKPEAGSYLQQTGYEEPMQAGAVVEPQLIEPVNRPLATEPLQQNAQSNTSVEPAIQVAAEKAPEIPAPETNPEPEPEATAPAADMVQNFLNRQAQRLYEAFANTTILGTSNRLDLYS